MLRGAWVDVLNRFTVKSDPFQQGMEKKDVIAILETEKSPPKNLQTKYHKTEHFQRLKSEAIALHGKCQLCPKNKSLTFHHTTYKTLFCENMVTDGVVVCPRCHSKLHGKRS